MTRGGRKTESCSGIRAIFKSGCGRAVSLYTEHPATLHPLLPLARSQFWERLGGLWPLAGILRSVYGGRVSRDGLVEVSGGGTEVRDEAKSEDGLDEG